MRSDLPDHNYNQFRFFVGENKNSWDAEQLATGETWDTKEEEIQYGPSWWTPN